MDRFKAWAYTYKHKKAFLKVEKEVLGHNTFRGLYHDLDKLILYPILGKKLTSKIHRKYACHHINNLESPQDYEHMIIDWECARYTKPDKPLSAYDFLMTKYPDRKDEILPFIKKLGLAPKEE